MRSLVVLILFAASCFGSPGCALPRAEQTVPEDATEWRRGGWMSDQQPGEFTPYRIHGGVGPASSSL